MGAVEDESPPRTASNALYGALSDVSYASGDSDVHFATGATGVRFVIGDTCVPRVPISSP